MLAGRLANLELKSVPRDAKNSLGACHNMTNMTSERAPPNHNKKELTNPQWIAVDATLLGMAKDGPLPHDSITVLAKKYGVTHQTISCMWLKITTLQLFRQVDTVSTIKLIFLTCERLLPIELILSH